MNKLSKIFFSSLLLGISVTSFAEGYGEFASIEDPAVTEKANKEYRAKQIKEIHEFMARDNALTQKFVKDKNSKPFIDERKEFDGIEKLQTRLIAKQLDFGGKETVAEMIKAQQNFLKNLDIKWQLAKERKYLDIKGAQPIFDEKKSMNEEDLKKLKNKLTRL